MINNHNVKTHKFCSIKITSHQLPLLGYTNASALRIQVVTPSDSIQLSYWKYSSQFQGTNQCNPSQYGYDYSLMIGFLCYLPEIFLNRVFSLLFRVAPLQYGKSYTQGLVQIEQLLTCLSQEGRNFLFFLGLLHSSTASLIPKGLVQIEQHLT